MVIEFLQLSLTLRQWSLTCCQLSLTCYNGHRPYDNVDELLVNIHWPLTNGHKTLLNVHWLWSMIIDTWQWSLTAYDHWSVAMGIDLTSMVMNFSSIFIDLPWMIIDSRKWSLTSRQWSLTAYDHWLLVHGLGLLIIEIILMFLDSLNGQWLIDLSAFTIPQLHL